MQTETKPLKRSKQLTPLSREHHEGLLLCWKIREGLAKDLSPERIADYILHFFRTNLEAHFQEEEQFIFPLLDASNNDRIEAEQHHKLLREMVSSLSEKHLQENMLLNEFEKTLETHIRFEERVLFPLIEKEVDADVLERAAENLKTEKNTIDWDDQFWISK